MTQQLRTLRLASRLARVSILAILALGAVAASLSVTDQAAARPNATISEVRLGSLDSLILSRTLGQWRVERTNLTTRYDWMDWHGDDCSPYSTSSHARKFEDACVRHQALSNTLPTLDDGSGSRWNQRNRYAADLRFALDLYGSFTVDNYLIYLNVTETSTLCSDMSRDMFGATRGRWWPPGYDYDQPANASVSFADPLDTYAPQVRKEIKLTDVSTLTLATLRPGAAGRLPLPIHYVEVNGEPLVPIAGVTCA